MSHMLIEFQDHHQDFLVWTVNEAGIVTESWPYQSDVWGQLKVVNLARLMVGSTVEYLWEGRCGTVKYPVRSMYALAPIDVSVRMDGSGYVTSTVRGKRAACTYSYEHAVQRLAEKLFPGRSTSIARVECMAVGRVHSKWRITPGTVE